MLKRPFQLNAKLALLPITSAKAREVLERETGPDASSFSFFLRQFPRDSHFGLFYGLQRPLQPDANPTSLVQKLQRREENPDANLQTLSFRSRQFLRNIEFTYEVKRGLYDQTQTPPLACPEVTEAQPSAHLALSSHEMLIMSMHVQSHVGERRTAMQTTALIPRHLPRDT